MKIKDIVPLLDAEILCGEDDLEQDIRTACGSDMMSDVLAFVKDQSALLTGLVNPQVIRTVLMMDIVCVIFVRGKRPTEEMIDLAEKSGIVLLSTPLRMYEACGKLYCSMNA